MVVNKQLVRGKWFWLSLGGVGLLIVAFVFVRQQHQQEKQFHDFKAKREQVLQDLSRVQASYVKRGDLIRQWAQVAAPKDREEIKVLLSENDGLRLSEHVELQRFEFVQERLNLLISKWSLDAKAGKAKPKELDSLEWQLQRQRLAYSASAQQLNAEFCSRCRDLHVPEFKADKSN